MEDALNVLVAIAAIYFAYRWLSRDNGGAGTGGNARPATVLGFTPKNVTPEMVNRLLPELAVMLTVHRSPLYEVRSRKNQCKCRHLVTSGLLMLPIVIIFATTFLNRVASKSLRTKYSSPPPAYFTLYPPTPAADVTTTDTPSPTSTNDTSVKNTSLLSRYGLEARANEGSATEFSDKAAWEDSASKREASLKERKAQMILAARQ
ncbi:hypothetical protein AG1IA_08411 [Rhizoctonia solani AG-1 IA]|uniref:Uncharacterized protein n=1 Tax=Thanatephorus cucumeris (strain AG1-IA) TaxID=983506 RepID=L8WLB6_THACA|nr:hypothetical protein AG1IA_08411 [Rhizoctonia solani AG-1 IA]